MYQTIDSSNDMDERETNLVNFKKYKLLAQH